MTPAEEHQGRFSGFTTEVSHAVTDLIYFHRLKSAVDHLLKIWKNRRVHFCNSLIHHIRQDICFRQSEQKQNPLCVVRLSICKYTINILKMIFKYVLTMTALSFGSADDNLYLTLSPNAEFKSHVKMLILYSRVSFWQRSAGQSFLLCWCLFDAVLWTRCFPAVLFLAELVIQ